MGQTYTIGKSSPINFTLKSAEFTLQPFSTENGVILPKGDEKRIVLRYTIHNPLPREQTFVARSLRFTAVDSKDVNHFDEEVATREGTQENLNIALKPAQKIEVQGVVVVPAKGGVPKLIVQRDADAPVIRYDLRGKVAALPKLVADPSDACGATALSPIPAEADVSVPLGRFDARLDSVTFSQDAMNGKTPRPGQRYLVATLTLKNPTSQPQALYGQH